MDGHAQFIELVQRNDTIRVILERAQHLAMPGWYLAAGSLPQTVWNVLDGHDPSRGIRDYDVDYFDERDLSWEAEDVVIRRCAQAFTDVAAVIEVRNEARVHLWYEDKFGIPSRPYSSTESAIDTFPTVASCVGITVGNGVPHVYAPHGLDDIFGFVVRPNPVLAPRPVYEAKAKRWQEQWPRLTVLPWPEPPNENEAG